MADAKACIIKRDGIAVAVTDNPLAWFHRHVAYCSMHHALEHEGYSVEEPEPWNDEEAQKERSQARSYLYGDEFHNRGGCRREGRLGQENCAQCCLAGYEPRGGFGDGYSVKRDGPNVAGWTRVYVQAERSIPRYWSDAFIDALNSDNRAYADALARDIATFGVSFYPATWHGAKPETLAAQT